ncbi:MAG TPA: helical backbone metal receptor [Gemmatimonadales bacterium]|nr:helical backbone metal receptor [Gemmatimonadales bacterium]
MARSLALLLALTAACSPRPPHGTLSITDDWGRTVALDAPARRIVSLSPSSTEILFAIGAGPRVAGRTAYCDWPAEARAVPSVGNGIEPSVEAVAARRPDLVVLYASAADRAALDGLTALRIPVAVLKLDLSVDVVRAARRLGVLAGDSAGAEAMVRRFEDSLAAVRARAAAAPGRRPVVYVDVWASPPMTVGRGSYLSEILDAAGAQNAFGELGASAATVSLESVAARDPDAVLVVEPDTLHPPDLAARPGWSAVRAVREGRVLVVDAGLYGRPGPRMPDAAADLARRLAPLRSEPRR